MRGLPPSSRAARWAAAGIVLLGTYFTAVLVMERQVLGFELRARHVIAGAIAAYLVLRPLLSLARARALLSRNLLRALALACPLLLCALLAVDIMTTLRRNGSVDFVYRDEERVLDPLPWLDRVLPPNYHPTEKNFLLAQPDTLHVANVYGAAYSPAVGRSQELTASVLERKRFDYRIDAHGFRETTDPRSAQIFVLGDGLAAGSFSRFEHHWVERLQQRLGRPIYSLGVGGTSPGHQRLLLEHLLETQPEVFPIRHLLWMINESGDLEGPYEELHGIDPQRRAVWRDTLVERFAAVPELIRDLLWTLRAQSALDRWLRPPEAWLDWSPGSPARAHWVVDGALLHRPLYRSQRFGPKLFDAVLIHVARQPESYVLQHPNRPALDQAFSRVKALADSRGFRVTVLVAPNAVRLYARHFDDFPPISDEPHFIHYVASLAKRTGFEVFDLEPPLRAAAARELLVWRDDEHWNPRGEQVVSEIVAKQVFGR